MLDNTLTKDNHSLEVPADKSSLPVSLLFDLTIAVNFVSLKQFSCQVSQFSRALLVCIRIQKPCHPLLIMNARILPSLIMIAYCQLTLTWRPGYHPRLVHDTAHPLASCATVQLCKESQVGWDRSWGGTFWSDQAWGARLGSAVALELLLSLDVSLLLLLTWWWMNFWPSWRNERSRFLQQNYLW